MANELSLRINAELVNGKLRERFSPNGGSFSVTQSTARAFGGTFGLTTSEEVLSAGDVSTLGYMFLQNMDSTNNVIYGPESSGALVPFGLLKPGESAVIRLQTGITIRAKASAGTPDLFYKILAD
jgi:hypothetical protein